MIRNSYTYPRLVHSTPDCCLLHRTPSMLLAMGTVWSSLSLQADYALLVGAPMMKVEAYHCCWCSSSLPHGTSSEHLQVSAPYCSLLAFSQQTWLHLGQPREVVKLSQRTNTGLASATFKTRLVVLPMASNLLSAQVQRQSSNGCSAGFETGLQSL